MADPTKYVPGYSYTGFQDSSPTVPLPADEVDNDLAQVSNSIDEIVDAIKDIRRSDGALKNQIVTYDSLNANLKARLAAIGFTGTDEQLEALFGYISSLTENAAPSLADMEIPHSTADGPRKIGATDFVNLLSTVGSATDGVSSVIGVDAAGTRLAKTVLPFITPEMYGADGTGDADDLAAVNYALEEARYYGIPLVGRGLYASASPFIFERPESVEYWDGSSNKRPISIYLDRILSTSEDRAVHIKGSLLSDKIEIGHIIGPGIGAVGTPGASAERIGVLLESEVNFSLGSATDFNFAVVMQNCFSSLVEIGFTPGCLKGLYARKRPSDGAENQRNNIRVRKTGGPFTSEAFGNDALRRSRSCDLGIHLESINGSILDLGSPEYCQMNADSRGVQIDSGCLGNDIYVYLEGARDLGDFLYSEGDSNNFHLAGLSSVSNIPSGKIEINGSGNHIYGLNSRLSAAARAAFVPNGAASIVKIGHGNTVHGRFKQKNLPAPSTRTHNLVLNTNTFTFTGSGSATSITSGLPAFLTATDGFEITCSGSDGVYYTSSAISINGEARDKLKVGMAIKGVTNHSKVAMFVLNGATDALIGDGVTTGLAADTDWQLLEFIETLPSGLTSIKLRIAARNPLTDETGCVLRTTRPMASFNIESPLVHCIDALDHTDTIPGRLMPITVKAYQGIQYKPQIVTDISATVFATNSRALVICTAHPSGSSVNSIANLVEDQPCKIINKSGSSITFTTSAGAWGTDIILADGEAMTVVRTTGNGAFTSDVFRVG